MAHARAGGSAPLLRALRFVHLWAYRVWIGLLTVKVAIVIALLGIIALDAVIQHAHAATAKRPVAGRERAYTLTLMCATVAAKDQNPQDIQRTMDAARKMAKAQGYGTDRLSHDLTDMASVFGADLRDDPDLLDKDRQMCRKIGLIS